MKYGRARTSAQKATCVRLSLDPPIKQLDLAVPSANNNQMVELNTVLAPCAEDASSDVAERLLAVIV